MQGEPFRLVRLLFHLAVKDGWCKRGSHISEDRCLSRDRRASSLRRVSIVTETRSLSWTRMRDRSTPLADFLATSSRMRLVANSNVYCLVAPLIAGDIVCSFFQSDLINPRNRLKLDSISSPREFSSRLLLRERERDANCGYDFSKVVVQFRPRNSQGRINFQKFLETRFPCSLKISEKAIRHVVTSKEEQRLDDALKADMSRGIATADRRGKRGLAGSLSEVKVRCVGTGCARIYFFGLTVHFFSSGISSHVYPPT